MNAIGRGERGWSRRAALAAAATCLLGLVAPLGARGAGPAAATLTATPLDPADVKLSWTLPEGAMTTQVYRAGRLLDQFASSAGTAYQDHLLWQQTTYAYEVKVLDGSGAILADLTASATTPRRTTPFARLYSATSFWNTPIPANPAIDPSSATLIATSIVPTMSKATFSNNGTWGIPLAYANPASEQYSVGCLYYGCTIQVNFRIPRYAKQNAGTDGKLVVLDPSGSKELDMGRASYDGTADSWTSGSRYVTGYFGWGAMCTLGKHCDGVLMSGFDQFAGVVRPEEIQQGHIDHALALIIPYWRKGFIACPAVKTTGGADDPNAIPIGAQLQLDPTFNVDGTTWAPWQKTIAKALQTYGAYVWDAGGTGPDIRAEATLDRGYDAWTLVGIDDSHPGSASLNMLPWNLMRVLKITQC